MFPSRVTHVHSPRLFGLDFLRALAIGAVVVSHGFSFLMPHLPWWCGFLGHSGFYGVELFFALSGFLIGSLLIRTGSALAQPDRLVTFYIRRWFRTLPLFWLFIGFQILLELGLRNRHLSYSEIVQHAFFLRNFNALKITFFPESWSLAVEEWFYLLFPALLWLGLRSVTRFNFAFLSVVGTFFLFSTIARMIEASHPYAHWPDWQRELVILRFDALMVGVFAAWISVNYPRAWYGSRWLVGALGVAILFAMYASLWRITDHHLEWSADSYFARTFRFNLVSLGFAMLSPSLLPGNWCAKPSPRPQFGALLSGHTLFISFTSRFSRWCRSTRQRGGPVHSFKAWLLHLCNLPQLSQSARFSIAIMNRAAPICANASLPR